MEGASKGEPFGRLQIPIRECSHVVLPAHPTGFYERSYESLAQSLHEFESSCEWVVVGVSTTYS
eukprot:scaffold8732_cov87-Cylindrotheca_fusiformis.AAC.4